MITDTQFLKFHTGYYGEVVDHTSQIAMIRFDGEELLEYLQAFEDFLKASEGEAVPDQSEAKEKCLHTYPPATVNGDKRCIQCGEKVG